MEASCAVHLQQLYACKPMIRRTIDWDWSLEKFRFLFIFTAMVSLVGCTVPGTVTSAVPPTPVSVHTSPPERTEVAIPAQTVTPAPVKSPTSVFALEIMPAVTMTVERYGLLELDLLTDITATNPYDPDEIELRVHFNAPSGREVVVGAFWYQDYGLVSRQPSGKPGWKVRFTPDETGDWTAKAFAPALGLESNSLAFTIYASNRPGFIRIHPTNPHYFALDNGDFFFPIGLNMGWWGGCCDPLDQYGRWFDLFSANGGNTIRVWMAAWSFGIEWKDTGLGDYDHRLYEAWLLDQLFRLADEHGIKIILVLMNHGPLSLSTNTEWEGNPYSAALGGPLTDPGQFVNDPVAKSYFQRRLNYIINRWGYSPDLLAWEWFNEVNLTAITDEALIPWIREMTGYLHLRDINHHLTTNSFAIRTSSPVWQLPELDIAQKHEYADQIGSTEHDLAGRAAQDFSAFAESMPPKPILLGEFGYSANNYGDNVEKKGIHLHNGLWSTTFSGYAGSGMYWWWDVYIEAYNLWYHYKGLADFLNGEDLTQYRPFSPLNIADSNGASGRVTGLGLRGKDILVWFRSNDFTTQASIAACAGKPESSIYVPPMVEGQRLTLEAMADGDYTVRWYEPLTARWLEAMSIRSENSALTIPIPAFRYDLAAKISWHP